MTTEKHTAVDAKNQIGAYANIHPDQRQIMTFGGLLQCLWRIHGARETMGYECAEIMAALLDEAAKQQPTTDTQQAAEPQRCKHDVWPYDHCWACEKEQAQQAITSLEKCSTCGGIPVYFCTECEKGKWQTETQPDKAEVVVTVKDENNKPVPHARIWFGNGKSAPQGLLHDGCGTLNPVLCDSNGNTRWRIPIAALPQRNLVEELSEVLGQIRNDYRDKSNPDNIEKLVDYGLSLAKSAQAKKDE